MPVDLPPRPFADAVKCYCIYKCNGGRWVSKRTRTNHNKYYVAELEATRRIIAALEKTEVISVPKKPFYKPQRRRKPVSQAGAGRDPQPNHDQPMSAFHDTGLDSFNELLGNIGMDISSDKHSQAGNAPLGGGDAKDDENEGEGRGNGEEDIDADNGDGGEVDEVDQQPETPLAAPSTSESSSLCPPPESLIEDIQGWNDHQVDEDSEPPVEVLMPPIGGLPTQYPQQTPLDYTDLPQAKLPKLKLAQDMIKNIRNAKLEDDIKDPNVLYRLRNPDQTTPDLDETAQASIRTFNALAGYADDAYNKIRNVLATHSDPIDIHSHHITKKNIEELTNIPMLLTDMCPNSCHAFTGPFEDYNICTNCKSARYDPSKPGQKVPMKQFYTLPLGPMLQAQYRTPEGAKRMRYRHELTEELLAKLESGNGCLDELTDFFHSEDYIKMATNPEDPLTDDDVFVQLSIDGAQLYRDKASDCWFFVWIIMDLSPGLRYKKKYVLPGGFVPGPQKPVVTESFLLPSFRHVSALQKEGLKVYNGLKKCVGTVRVFVASAGADTVGLTVLDGRVGHSGYYACRIYCGFPGRHKPGVGIYYPAALKPDNYNVTGCDHPDLDIADVGPPDPGEYMRNLAVVLSSQTITQYKANQLLTGIVRPSICLGFQPKFIFSVPTLFTLDLMHLCGLNLPQLLISIWRGNISLDQSKSGKPRFFVLDRSALWKEHGALVESVRSYLPGSFNRPPRNPAEKINSGYKAIEFNTYFWVIGPAVFRPYLPHDLWVHFCKLVRGVRIIHQRVVRPDHLVIAHEMLTNWEKDFELLYYQRRVEWLHLVRPCVHAITHAARETIRRGPLNISAQWALENTIGNLGREVHLFSNPFSNLAERGALRARMIALYALIPDLDPPPKPVRGSKLLGDGFVLLRARSRTQVLVPDIEREAFKTYFNQIGLVSTTPPIQLHKWARLCLPNGQVARSAWKEKERREPRISRNIKFSVGNKWCYGEVHHYCYLPLQGQERALALVSVYSNPHPVILEKSCGTLRVCRRNIDSNFWVIDVKSIDSVVGMIPYPLTEEEKMDRSKVAMFTDCYYVAEKLVLEKVDEDVATMT